MLEWTLLSRLMKICNTALLQYSERGRWEMIGDINRSRPGEYGATSTVKKLALLFVDLNMLKLRCCYSQNTLSHLFHAIYLLSVNSCSTE